MGAIVPALPSAAAAEGGAHLVPTGGSCKALAVPVPPPPVPGQLRVVTRQVTPILCVPPRGWQRGADGDLGTPRPCALPVTSSPPGPASFPRGPSGVSPKRWRAVAHGGVGHGRVWGYLGVSGDGERRLRGQLGGTGDARSLGAMSSWSREVQGGGREALKWWSVAAAGKASAVCVSLGLQPGPARSIPSFPPTPAAIPAAFQHSRLGMGWVGIAGVTPLLLVWGFLGKRVLKWSSG